jgi:predicted kinase
MRLTGHRPPLTAAERLAHQFEQEIVSGRRPHGSQFEASTVLAKAYATSPGTLSRAFALLVAKDLVLGVGRSRRVVNYPAGIDRQQPERVDVVLVGGYAGSGKTELGRILARRTHWAMLDKDSTTRPVVEAALSTIGLDPNDRSSEQYMSVVRPAEYEALLMGLRENLECGTSCIVTAPFVAEFGSEAWCERTRSWIASLGATAHFVWVACDADTMLSYVRTRGAGRDNRKLADWPAWIASIDLDFRPVTEHHVVDNSAECVEPLQQQAKALLAKIVA